MFEDKLPKLLEVNNHYITKYNNLQEAKRKGIKINSIEENLKDSNKENISANEFSDLISKTQDYIKYIEAQTNQLIKIKNKVLYSTNDEEKEISQNLNDIFSKVNNSRIKMDQIQFAISIS